MAKEKEDDFNPFDNLDKATVLQECRVFHDVDLNPRVCCELITKILYVLSQGDRISQKNATNVFFGATNRLYLISFVETSAPGGLPASGTAVLIDFRNTPTKI